MPDNVTEGKEFINYIKSHVESVLSDTEVDFILQNLVEMRLEDSHETDRAHVEHIKNIKEN